MAPRAHIAAYKVCYGTNARVMTHFGWHGRRGGRRVDVLSSRSAETRTLPLRPHRAGRLQRHQQSLRQLLGWEFRTGPQHPVERCAVVADGGRKHHGPLLLATVKLGDGQEFDGETLYQPHDFGSKMLPLMYPNANEQSSFASAALWIDSTYVERSCCATAAKTVELKRVKSSSSAAAQDDSCECAGGRVRHRCRPHVLLHQTFPTLTDSRSSPTSIPRLLHGNDHLQGHRHEHAPLAGDGLVLLRGPSQITPVILKPDITGRA
ncbi:subtilisin-like protease [Musa troglodytarum]|nr:subtilisin-like protease [Musa troglodytarum]